MMWFFVIYSIIENLKIVKVISKFVGYKRLIYKNY